MVGFNFYDLLRTYTVEMLYHKKPDRWMLNKNLYVVDNSDMPQ